MQLIRSAFKASAGLVLVLLLAVPVCLQAQSDNARISGTVTDTSGAAIPGATITVTNLGTSAIQKVTSGASGDFNVAGLPPGSYKAEVAASGFSGQVQNIQLQVSQVQALNFKLAVGAVSTEIQVTDAAPQVDTTTSNTGLVIQGRQLADLPLNGRNFTQLALLAPGITRGQSNNSSSGYQHGQQPVETIRYNDTGGAGLSANGLRPQANNFLLDGLDNNESLVNTIVVFPPVEAMSEFRVTNSLAPAEFGRAGGAIVQAAVKSGTNSIHGSAFIFYRDSKVGAASPNYFSPTTPVISYHRNIFGGTLGLPIWKDRVFAFGDYQGTRTQIPNGGPSINTVPTAKMRTGDFSELIGSQLTLVPTVYGGTSYSPTGCASFTTVHGYVVTTTAQLNATPDNGAIFDPLTCKQFGTASAPNVIPTNRLNPVALKYFAAFPNPNRTPQSQVLNNYQNIQLNSIRYNDMDARLDFHISSKDSVFVRGSYGEDNNTLTTALATLPSGFGAGDNNTHPRELVGGYNHIFSSNLLNEFRFGYTRPFYGYINPQEGTPLSANLGIPNANRNPLLGGISLIGGGNTEISYTGDGGPYEVPQHTFQYFDAVSYTRGAHSIRAGANVMRREVDFFQAQYNAKGFFNLNSSDYTGYEASDLAAAFVDNYSISNPTGYYKTISYETGYFAQDDWRVSHRLTLNLGLRYDLYTHPYEQNNRQSNFDLSTATLQVAGANGNSRSLINTNFNNLAPRIGFAYDLFGNGKTALRGGYGIYYFLDRGGVGNQLSNNPDFNGSATYASSSGYRIDLSGQAPQITSTGPGPYAGNNSTLATGNLPSAIVTVNDAAPKNVTVISYPKNDPTSMIQQWNLQIEQQLGTKMVFDIAYVGTKADHLFNTINYTEPQLGTGLKFFQAQGLNVTLNEDNGTSHYDGLQTRLSRNLSNGLQFTAAYTWSHAMDNSVGPFSPEGASSAPVTPQGPQLSLNRGNSDDDQRNFFSFGALAELPFGRGKHFGANVSRPVDYVIGGWQLSPFVVWGSGTPFDVMAPASQGGVDVRPDLIGNPYQAPTPANGYQFLNPKAFASPPVNAQGIYTRVGNVHRNQFYGPITDTVSLSLFKDVAITDRVKAQLRGQVYNLLNSPQFANPSNTNLSSGSSFAVLNYINYRSERETELALRFTF